MNYIETVLSKNALVFHNVADVLVHMFCVLGNGVDSHTFNTPVQHSYEDDDGNIQYFTVGEGHYMNADYFDNLELQCPSLSYPYSANPEYRPYNQYRCIHSPETREGIKAAMRYLARCIEAATEEAFIKAFPDNQMQMHESYFVGILNENKDIPEDKKKEFIEKYKKVMLTKVTGPTEKEKESFNNDMNQWRQNLHELLNEIDNIK